MVVDTKNVRTVERTPDGKVVYKVDGVTHRDDGPAYIYPATGGKTLNTYYNKGMMHREDGAASYYTDDATGEVIPDSCLYFLHNRQIPKRAFTFKMVEKMKAYHLFSTKELILMKRNPDTYAYDLGIDDHT